MGNAKAESLPQVYANALLELAFGKGVHAEVLSELTDFGQVLTREERFRDFLNAPSIPQNAKKDVVKRVFGSRVSDPTLNFLLVVIDKRRQYWLLDMIERFEAGYHERMGELVVDVTSAVELDEAHRDRLRRTLNTKFGKEIILRERVVPRLLGGLVLCVGDTRIDGSLRTRLESIGSRLAAVRFRSEDYYEN